MPWRLYRQRRCERKDQRHRGCVQHRMPYPREVCPPPWRSPTSMKLLLWLLRIGSALLVKGLEFDHAVVVQSTNIFAKYWYAVLTRVTRTIRIVSSKLVIRAF